MTLLELLEECARQGIALAANGDKLQVRAAAGVLTAELQSSLREHKSALLERLNRGAAAEPLRDAKRGAASLPLSFAQQNLWFLHRLDPASVPAYNIRKTFVLDGSVDVDQWLATFAKVLNRHETLRSSFVDASFLDDAQPMAKVADAIQPPVTVIDLQHLDVQQQDAEVRRLQDEQGRFVFDLGAAPLIQAYLVRLRADRSLFLLNAHHLVADAWSSGVLLREMAELLRGNALPAPAYSYGQFAEWQRQQFESGAFDPHIAWWKKQLDGLPELRLPVDVPHAASPGYDGASESYELDAELSDALRAVSRREGVTLFSLCLASFAALLQRYTGQSDLAIGTSATGRTRTEFEDVVGLFASLLVLRTNVDPERPFRELVHDVQRVSAEASDHQDVPFDVLVKALQPARVIGRNPLFQVLFLFLNSDPTFQEVQTPSVISKFDLSLHVEDTGSTIRGLFEYKTSLFRRETIRAFLSAWTELLRGAVAAPSRSVATLPLLSAAERQQLLVASTGVEPAVIEHATLSDWFAAQAEATPDAIAVSAGETTLTYHELGQRAERLALRLRATGAGPESRVGLLLERSPEMIVAIVAVLKAGGVYVPLDPSDPIARLAFVCVDSRLTALLTANGEIPSELSAAIAERATANANAAPAVLSVVTADDADPATVPPQRRATAANAAYVIYTSGSTGEPRGVVVTHENVMRLMRTSESLFRFGASDVWTLFHSYAFDFSVWEIWGALLYGGRLVIVPKLVSRSPEEFHQLLIGGRVTVLNQTPSAFRALIPIAGKIASLRYVIFGGEALDLSMLEPWIARYGDDAPQLINMYGITETTVHVTWRRIVADDVKGSGSMIGAPLPDLTLHVLDADLQPLPIGVTGQLYVGGAGLSRGYQNRAALTAERFIPNPFASEPGMRLYRTGDLAVRRANNDVEYLGRCDAQLKIRGFRIEAGEVESAVRAHTGVKECVVTVVGDANDDKRLVAYYIPAGEAVDAAELRRTCEARLPSHMVPGSYVAVPAWPRTRNDKLDRAKLPLPDAASATARGSYVAPRDATERTLASIWERVLDVRDVGVEDDFFALGGDSILSLKVLAEMRRQGLQSSVAQLYGHNRIAALAQVVERVAEVSGAVAPFALLRAGDLAHIGSDVVDAYPLSQLQAGMLYEEQLDPAGALYHDIFSFHLAIPLVEEAWTRVVQQAVDRHELLRTAFDLSSFSEPLQLVRSAAPARCAFDDVSSLAPEAQDARIAAAIEAERRTPFDYSAPPLFRFHLLRRAEARTQIIFGFHHAIVDGWSVASLFSRLLLEYGAAIGLRALPAADARPAVRYADYIAEERAALANDQEFWKSEISALPATRIPRGAETRGNVRAIASFSVVVDDVTSNGLNDAARAAGVPIKTVALAAHLRVLAALTGEREVVTGLVTNGRPEKPGAERLVGLFLNTLPMRLEIGSGAFADLIGATFDAERRLLAHRRFPMAAVKRLAGGRQLFDAAFNFVHFHVYGDVTQTAAIEVLDHQVWEATDFPFLAQFSRYPGSPRLELTLIYDQAQFTAERIAEIAGFYSRCFAAIAAHAELPIRDVPLLPAHERALLEEWGGSAADVPVRESIHGWFEEQVARAPQRVALRHDGKTLTYRELDERANRLARYLIDRGVQRETLVGLALDRSLDLVVAIVAILKAGGAYVPLDPSLPSSRLRFLVDDSQVPLVVTSSAHAHLFAGRTGIVSVDGDAPAIAAQDAANPNVAISAEQAAYVIYTSGSTGTPKGVVVTHGNVTRLMASTEELYGFGEEDVWTLFHSYAFDFSVWEIWGALCYGGRLVIVPYDVSRTPEQFHRLLSDEGVTVLNQTPSAFYQLMALDIAPPASLRYVIFGGEALDLSRLQRWVSRYGDERPQLINMYGITETTVHVTYRRIVASDIERGAGSVIGRPLRDLAAYVLDSRGEIVPIGVPGELYVGGAGVARGYLRRDELTAQRFIDDERGENKRGRLYRTGDLVRWTTSGELEYLGRIDTQVKIRGFRIELGEIEHLLLTKASLREVAVHARTGATGQTQLIAWFVAGGREVTPAELRRICEEHLPEYMVPSGYVALEKLPLTANGKLDRDALPDPGDGALPEVPYVAPRSDVEIRLCLLWEQVLGVSRIGITQSFFGLGGHSLHATQLMARVRETFSVELPLRTLFDAPTVEQLARAIEQQRAPQASPAGELRDRPIRRRESRTTRVASETAAVTALRPDGTT